MKFTCERNELLEACSTAMRAVPSKSPITALEGLLISSENESLKITGYDLKKAIYTKIDANITEGGTICVGGRFFSEMVRRMQDGIITISTDENYNITAKCGKSEYNFVSLPASEYPEMPIFDGVSKIEIPQAILKNMINKTLFAVSKDEVRPIYTGILFEIIGEELTLVSVDGYRLARRTEKIEGINSEDFSFIVPGTALNDVEKICDQDENAAPVVIELGDKHISFTINNTVIITRRLEGDFINHRKSVPTEFKYEVEVEKSEFSSVIDRVGLVLSEKNNSPVRLTFNNGSINCLCVTPVGKAQDVCFCSGSGEGLEIGFNDRYIIDALRACEDDKIKICINASSMPAVIKAVDGKENYTYMILPVRLHQ